MAVARMLYVTIIATNLGSVLVWFVCRLTLYTLSDEACPGVCVIIKSYKEV